MINICVFISVNQGVTVGESVDQGYLLHKEYLPVLEMHLGDTGSTIDDNWSEYNIGELECFGDSEFYVMSCVFPKMYVVFKLKIFCSPLLGYNYDIYCSLLPLDNGYDFPDFYFCYFILYIILLCLSDKHDIHIVHFILILFSFLKC